MLRGERAKARESAGYPVCVLIRPFDPSTMPCGHGPTPYRQAGTSPFKGRPDEASKEYGFVRTMWWFGAGAGGAPPRQPAAGPSPPFRGRFLCRPAAWFVPSRVGKQHISTLEEVRPRKIFRPKRPLKGGEGRGRRPWRGGSREAAFALLKPSHSAAPSPERPLKGEVPVQRIT